MADRIDTSPAAIAGLLDGVTPSPWDYLPWASHRIMASYMCINGLSALFTLVHINVPDDAERGYTDDAYNPDTANANARFIAAARELVPTLAAERDALKSRAEAAEAEVARRSEMHECAMAERDDCIEDWSKARAEIERLTAERDALRAAQDALVAAAYEAAAEVARKAIPVLHPEGPNSDEEEYIYATLGGVKQDIRRLTPADAVAALAAYARAERNKARLEAAGRMRIGGLHTIDDRVQAICAMIEKEPTNE